jgi:IclR family pca regulon transcriptional regulator
MLLAGMPDEEIEDYLARTDLVAFQSTTITDKALLWREIRSIRKRGYSESHGELFSGGGALASAIRDFSGKTVGVIDILTPAHRYTPEHRDLCIRELVDGVRRASERLGYRPESDR